MRFVRLLVVGAACVAGTFAISGCSTLADATQGSGTLKVYARPFDRVWEATVDSAQEAGLTLVSVNKPQGVILAQSTMGFFTWGENVAIYVAAVSGQQTQTRVEVVSKALMTGNITAYNWERRVFEKLDPRIAVMK